MPEFQRFKQIISEITKKKKARFTFWRRRSMKPLQLWRDWDEEWSWSKRGSPIYRRNKPNPSSRYSSPFRLSYLILKSNFFLPSQSLLCKQSNVSCLLDSRDRLIARGGLLKRVEERDFINSKWFVWPDLTVQNRPPAPCSLIRFSGPQRNWTTPPVT